MQGSERRSLVDGQGVLDQQPAAFFEQKWIARTPGEIHIDGLHTLDVLTVEQLENDVAVREHEMTHENEILVETNDVLEDLIDAFA